MSPILEQKLSTSSQNISQLQRIYPWIIISVAALFLFYKYVLQVAPSVMSHDLMAYFHINGAGLGNLAASYFYAYLITQLFVGVLLDKYSLRRLVTLAISISALGAMLFAVSHNLYLALIGRGLIGVGAAFATVCYLKVASLWFKPRQFAYVSGLLLTAGMIGSIAGQAPLAYAVSHEGWRSAMFDIGVAGLLLSALFYAIARDRKASDSAAPDDHNHVINMKSFLALLKKKHNWLLALYSGLAFSPVAVFGGLWGNPYLQVAYHLDKTQAGSLISMMFLGLAVGGPLLGWLSGRLNQRYSIMVGGLIISFLALVAALYWPSLPTWGVGFALFIFGFSASAFMLGFAVGRDLNHAYLAASIIALINTGDAIFGAFTEPLVGKFLDMFSHSKTLAGVPHFSLADYHLSLLILPIYLVLALACLVWVKASSSPESEGR